MVRNELQDPSGLGQPVSLGTVVARTWIRLRRRFRSCSPYRVGDAVVGDDPFNGRREGVVISHRGTSVGVHTAAGVFFYDHRMVKPHD
ncbi:hypothetical protein [Arthrobacter sp. AD-310]